jgi:putative cell wall-binding protein
MNAFRPATFSAARVAAAVVPILVALAILPASATAAPVTRSVPLAEVASVQPSPPGSILSKVVIDENAQRAYGVDVTSHTVFIYDVSGDSFVPVSVLPTSIGLGFPADLSINTRTRQLLVLDATVGDNAVVAVDIDPSSPTVNQVVKRVRTGGRSTFGIEADSETNRVYVSNQLTNDATIVNLNDGSIQMVSAIGVPRAPVVDPISHWAYIPSSTEPKVTAIDPTGVASTWLMTNPPRQIAVADGLLVVVSSTSAGAVLESFDLLTHERVAVSPPLAAPNTTAVAVDPALHLVYVSYYHPGAPGVQVFRTGSLAVEGASEANMYGQLTVEHSTHRLFAVETSEGSEVRMYRPNPSPLPSVSRIGGADRFAVSAAVSGDSFSSGVPVVYVASGAGYADALSGSAAAGLQGGPVLLVTRDAIPAAVDAELSRLKPRRIVLLGGTASVSAETEAQLRTYSPSVTRVAGADRYDVSAGVSAAAFTAGAATAYVASGATFPDALSGSAAAGHHDGPVLLVEKDAVPPAVAAELARLKPKKVVVLGGSNSISDAVLAKLQETLPAARIGGADRFAVSAAVSASAFQQGIYTVYVASGAVFPDALSGSAAAIANDAPVLLVNSDSVPATTAAELTRLHPYRIVVLGGTNTVSNAVLSQLESYLPQ